jgi:SNF2 family DNA or RNA helicase
MKVTLAKDEGHGRRVLLIMSPDEVASGGYVVEAILGGKARAVRKHDPLRQTYKYYFAMRYLDDVLMAFPQANKSRGLQRRMDIINSRKLHEREVEPFDIPGLWDHMYDKPAEPFPHQYIAIAECLRFVLGEMDEDQTEHFLENDEMGLGKTLILQAAASMFRQINGGGKVLIIVPRSGKSVHQRENDRWFRNDLMAIFAEQHSPGRRQELIKEHHDFTVVNPEMLRDEQSIIFKMDYELGIVDEYHRFGSPISLQTQGLFKLNVQRWLPASGTPFLNRPEQLWPIYHICWPKMYPDYDMFCRAIQVKDHRKKVVGYRPSVMRQMKSFMDPRSIRRRKDQVIEGLPEALPIEVPIQLNREQRKIYNLIRDKFLLMLDGGEIRNIAQVRSQVTRLNQACWSPELFGGSRHSAKLDELHASVESLTSSGQKIIIGSKWAKATRILQREFAAFDPAYVDGSVSSKRRMEQEDRFNHDDDCRLYIGTIDANKETISLGAATVVIFTDKDWSPQVNQQFWSRSAAGGLRGLEAEVDHVSVISMLAEGTWESNYEHTVAAFKEGMFRALIDNDGGPKFHKSVMSSLRELV